MKKVRANTSHFIVLAVLLVFTGCSVEEDKPAADTAGSVNVKQTNKVVEMDNGLVKGCFTIVKDGIEQQYFARKGSKWVLIASSFKPPKPFPKQGNALYDSGSLSTGAR